jgi:Holliday junction resolvase
VGAVAYKKAAKKESLGQRGKDAEKSARDVLEEWNTKHATFAFERLADARAAGGRIKKQISDYMCWHLPLCIPLEVKSTEHPYRLPKANLEQLPRLKKVALAGAKPLVLVEFKTIGWRIAPVSYFQFGVPSWDMSDLPVFATAKEALQSTGFFPSGD